VSVSGSEADRIVCVSVCVCVCEWKRGGSNRVCVTSYIGWCVTLNENKSMAAEIRAHSFFSYIGWLVTHDG
jgi:hypothetical protein